LKRDRRLTRAARIALTAFRADALDGGQAEADGLTVSGGAGVSPALVLEECEPGA
jgi:hypothetical protein